MSFSQDELKIKRNKFFDEPQKFNLQLKNVIKKSKLSDDDKRDTYDNIFRYGPVTPYLENDDITNIYINDFDKIYVDKNGARKKTKDSFGSRERYLFFIKKICSELNLVVSRDNPAIHAALPSGDRISIFVPPVTKTHPIVCIRKHNLEEWDLESLAENKFITKSLIPLMQIIMENKLNMVIVGPTGSGKTTLLSSMLKTVTDRERVVIIDDANELLIHEEKDSIILNTYSKYETQVNCNTSAALRMNPDRIIINEIRDEDFKYVFQTATTGHGGFMSTLHAGTEDELTARIKSNLGLNSNEFAKFFIDAFDIVIGLNKKEGLLYLDYISEPYVNEDSKEINFSSLITRDRENLLKCSYTVHNKQPLFIKKIKNKQDIDKLNDCLKDI